jgi:tetratricopeptide (TPR) repeat protein
MANPRAVVIPFGVPDAERGLGLGLAALLHGSARIDGENVALAQLHARRSEDASRGAPHRADPAPVEAFVPPNTWRDIAATRPAPMELALVVTGSFEPPGDGRGLIQLLAFDPASGATKARVEAHLDESRAGATVLAAFDELWRGVGGELPSVRDIGDLDWEALRSVLLAERCALHDPLRGGPHDRLAAIAHLERAIGDAPEGKYATSRIVAIALETALAEPRDARIAHAALRALERAAMDAPNCYEIEDAIAALEIALGRARAAEERMNAAIAASPKDPRSYARLAQALAARGNVDGAIAALQAGLVEVPGHPLLVTECGVALARRGDFVGAAAAWRAVLARDAVHVVAFAHLADLAARQEDALTAQALVDAALAAPRAHPIVLRRATQLALASEVAGLARSARVARLARALVAEAPEDAWAARVLGRALTELGETEAAHEHLARAAELAPAPATPAVEAPAEEPARGSMLDRVRGFFRRR